MKLASLLLLLMLVGCGAPRRSDDELVMMQTEAPRSMDPGNHTATYTTAVLDPMYESLVQFDEKLNLVPGLATEWHSNPAGNIWTAKLRTGVFFHDGTKLDAPAAVASFARLLDAKRGLAGSGSFRSVVERVTVCENGSAVCFFLREPYAALPSLLTVTPVVSPKADAKGMLEQHAVGTGPYKFIDWKTGEYVLEERNLQYWGPKPKWARLKWIWSTEPALMNMAIAAREVDLVNPLPPVFAEALRRNKRVKLLEGKSSAVFWVALNMRSKPLDDVRVRQALNYATDRAALIRSQLRGYGLPANSPLAPADFGYDPAIRGYAFNLAKARALLVEAGFGQGFHMNVAAQEGQTNIVQALAGMWAQINVTLHIRQMETGVFSQAIFGSPAQKREQDIQAVFASWTSSNLDAEHQLGPLYRTKSWAPAGANLGFYSNKKLDLLLDQAARELNVRKREELYSEAQQIISDDAPHVLLYYVKDLAAEQASLSRPWIFPGGEVRLAGDE